MSEEITITDSIEINDNSKERVAFYLTNKIEIKEKLYEEKDTYRKKILDLYAECLDATNGYRGVENT